MAARDLRSDGSQSVIPGPAASASSENLLEMQIFRPAPDLLHQALRREEGREGGRAN